MTDVLAGRSRPLAARHRDSRRWSSSRPVGVAGRAGSSFSRCGRVFWGGISHPRRKFGGMRDWEGGGRRGGGGGRREEGEKKRFLLSSLIPHPSESLPHGERRVRSRLLAVA